MIFPPSFCSPPFFPSPPLHRAAGAAADGSSTIPVNQTILVDGWVPLPHACAASGFRGQRRRAAMAPCARCRRRRSILIARARRSRPLSLTHTHTHTHHHIATDHRARVITHTPGPSDASSKPKVRPPRLSLSLSPSPASATTASPVPARPPPHSLPRLWVRAPTRDPLGTAGCRPGGDRLARARSRRGQTAAPDRCVCRCSLSPRPRATTHTLSRC